MEHENSTTSLHVEARKGMILSLKFLLLLGHNVDAQDENGKTALMLAMEGSHDGTIAVLFEHRPNIHIKDNTGRSALQMAFEVGRSRRKIVGKFLNVLKWECSNDSEKIAATLTSLGCPLYYAVMLKDSKVTRLMLEAGCDIDARDRETRKTALHVAVVLKDLENVKLIVEYGANVDAMDSDDKTALSYHDVANDSKQELDVLKLLVDRSSTLTSRDRFGRMQLFQVLRRGQREAVRMILRTDIDWCARDVSGQTPVHYLAINSMLYDNQDIVDDLRGKRIDANALDLSNTGALLLAASRGFTRLVELLLDNGADPNVINISEITSLYNACCYPKHHRKAKDYKQIVMLLLEHGADPQVIAMHLKTVFSCVIEHQNYTLAEPLLGQLVINESLGIPLTRYIQRQISLHQPLRCEFELCKLQLEKLKQTTIRRSISLFELLNKNVKTIALYARNRDFFDELTSLKKPSFNSYYCHILQTKIQKALQLVRLRNDTTELVCSSMGICYDSYPALVDRITEYIIAQDM